MTAPRLACTNHNRMTTSDPAPEIGTRSISFKVLTPNGKMVEIEWIGRDAAKDAL
jgi:hypothetical protein